MRAYYGRLFARLHALVGGTLLLALLGGLLLPVYSDEVGWRLQERGWLDGVDKLYSENCGPNTLARPLWFMWPVRWYSAFFNTHFADPFWVRVSGVAYALALAWLVWRLIARIGRDHEQQHKLGVIAATLMGLGVTPLLMVWSRPEQPILLALTGALVIAAQGWRGPGTVFPPLGNLAYRPSHTAPATAWWRSLAILGLGIITLSYHFKGVGVMPVLALAIAFGSRGNRTLLARGVCIALLLLASGAAAKYWVGRMECPADPIIAHSNAKENLIGELITGGAPALEIGEKLLNNFRPHKYLDLAAPMPRPMSRWLPAGLISEEEMHGWQGGMAAVWGVALGAAIIASLLMGWRAWREKVLPPELVLGWGLLGVASVWCISQRVRHVYESSFVMPLVMLGIILLLAAPHGSLRLRKAVAVLALGTGPLLLLSVALVARDFGPALWQATHARGDLPDQPYSVPVFGYGGGGQSESAQITTLARACRLPDWPKAQALLIDDITYFAAMRSRLPDHQLAVLVPRMNGVIEDPLDYLRARGSSGILVSCRHLPPELRAKALANGQYCCINLGGPATK